MNSGVSIVICCHNGIKRLPSTLEYIKQQRSCEYIPWEVILIDNASNDGTAELAKKLWSRDAPTTLEVIKEEKLGLTYARHKGLISATYDLVSFVDDDNWIEPEWIKKVFTIMNSHHDVGACGGSSLAVFEVPPPTWMTEHQERYAVGIQANQTGDITSTRGWLWGAGLTIRKIAWLELFAKGFKPILSGRKGKLLTTGEDVELCMALRLAGWRIWYEEELEIQHYIPADRISWQSLRNLMYTNGTSGVYINMYDRVFRNQYSNFKSSRGSMWFWELVHQIKHLLGINIIKILMSPFFPYEGDPDMLQIEHAIGYLQELFKFSREYDNLINSLYNAKWRVAKE